MKILFVCLGNICRSPLAEGIMKEKIRIYNLDAVVDSCGFESYHVGEGADPRSCDIAAKNGISLDRHSARRFRISDFDEFDKIYVMDSNNYYDVKSVARNQADIEKVDFILNEIKPGSNEPVPDPYYGGKDGFRNIYNMLDEACEVIANKISKE